MYYTGLPTTIRTLVTSLLISWNPQTARDIPSCNSRRTPMYSTHIASYGMRACSREACTMILPGRYPFILAIVAVFASQLLDSRKAPRLFDYKLVKWMGNSWASSLFPLWNLAADVVHVLCSLVVLLARNVNKEGHPSNPLSRRATLSSYPSSKCTTHKNFHLSTNRFMALWYPKR